MLNYLHILLATGAIGAVLITQPNLGRSQEKGESERIYAGRDLDNARKMLAEHKFKDNDIRRAFYDKDTQSVILKLMQSGREIRQIRIYQGTREQKGRLTLIKTIGDPKDPDFRALIDRLGL